MCVLAFFVLLWSSLSIKPNVFSMSFEVKHYTTNGFPFVVELKHYKTNGFLAFLNSSIIKPMVFLLFRVGPGTRDPDWDPGLAGVQNGPIVIWKKKLRLSSFLIESTTTKDWNRRRDLACRRGDRKQPEANRPI